MVFERGSNLKSFLDCTTPVVRSQFLPKTAIRNINQLWQPWEKENIEYFTLGDLWNCYDEWSVYGAGVKVQLNKEESVVQYYVPYLSAIQIFTSNPSVMTGFREGPDMGDSETRDSFRNSYSDESEADKLSRWEHSSEEYGFEQETFWHMNERFGCLYFHYVERSSPYGRVPLTDKINEFSRRYPGLRTLRSVDLSPASWMAVAWYPIYHIPTGRTVKDLSACFLTYHTLSSSFQDIGQEEEMGIAESKRKDETITLPALGMATYKIQGNLWFSDEDGQDYERLVSLLSAADSWLKQLGVSHHDFNHFNNIRHG